jgi:geranylgeranyl pyrophosphate synthase
LRRILTLTHKEYPNKREEVTERLTAFNLFFTDILDKYLDGCPGAVRYCPLSGGKRLRPYMLLEFTRALSGYADPYTAVKAEAGNFCFPCENTERMAVAIELIHCYSLVHDDMPAMDNDDIRRGKPTCHKAFGEWQALLAGDCLLNLAFEILLKGSYGKSYIDAISFIADMSGIKGMAGGQWRDLSGVNTLDGYIDMVSLKTSALFIAACVSPAIYVDSPREVGHLRDFAVSFGLAFQIKDDLDDLLKKEEASILHFKTPLQAEKELAYYKDKAASALNKISGKTESIADLLILL